MVTSWIWGEGKEGAREKPQIPGWHRLVMGHMGSRKGHLPRWKWEGSFQGRHRQGAGSEMRRSSTRAGAVLIEKKGG